MGKLENVLLIGILFLVIGIVIILMLPDKEGNNGFEALSPLMNQASQALGRSFNQISADITQWSNRVIGEMRRNPSRPAAGNDQGNPIDNAISPVQDYGEQQKEMFNKPLP
jgi:hypothetical protein